MRTAFIESCPELEAQIPRLILQRLKAYALDHVPVGDFLTAVLENDFRGACCRADDVNLGLLKVYALYVYNALPSQCHGSPENVRAWLDKCEAIE